MSSNDEGRMNGMNIGAVLHLLLLKEIYHMQQREGWNKHICYIITL